MRERERDAHCRPPSQTRPRRPNNACPFRPFPDSGTSITDHRASPTTTHTHGISRPLRPVSEELASTPKPLNLICLRHRTQTTPNAPARCSRLRRSQSSSSPTPTSSRHGPSPSSSSYSLCSVLTSSQAPSAKTTKKVRSVLLGHQNIPPHPRTTLSFTT